MEVPLDDGSLGVRGCVKDGEIAAVLGPAATNGEMVGSFARDATPAVSTVRRGGAFVACSARNAVCSSGWVFQ